MTKNYSKIIVAIILLVAPMLHARELVSINDTVSVQVYYRQGISVYEGGYKNNDISLARFASRIDSMRVDTLTEIRRVKIKAGASPEGSSTLNDRLSRERAASIREQILLRLPYLENSLDVSAVGVDWEGLTCLVKENKLSVPYYSEVIDILENTPEWTYGSNGKVIDSRKKKLMDLHGGVPWNYLYNNFFPQLRGASSKISAEIIRRVDPALLGLPHTLDVDTPLVVVEPEPILADTTAAVVVEEPVVDEKRPFYMAIKNNMVYDLLFIPNIGAEFYLGKNWSIVGNWHYAWWKCDHRHNYWRTYGGDLAVRKWFGSAAARKPLTGHHLGVYGQILTYDFELRGRGYLAPKWSYAGGVEYGYALPIAKRLNIDFTLGFGYMGGTYKEYLPIDQCYVWQVTKRRHWVGPTKCEISLMWLIGRGNVNTKKKKAE